MDEYGTHNLEDAKVIAENIKYDHGVVFGFSLDQMSAYVIHMTEDFKKLGTLPFGGDPAGCILVSLIRHGAFWFNPDHELHPSYVGEKLGIAGQDADSVTIMLNAIFIHIRELR